jgi:uncharacterized protein (DUF302 family)
MAMRACFTTQDEKPGRYVETTEVVATTHVTVSSHRSFDEVVGRLASLLGRRDGERLRDLVSRRASFEELEAAIQDMVGPSGFMIFLEVDHGGWISLAGVELKSKLYVIGNPLIAKRMLEHEPAVGLYVPVRIAVYEGGDGRTYLDFDKPSSLLRRLDNPKVDTIAAMLDEKLGDLVTAAA